MSTYKQCVLQRTPELTGALVSTVSYIPSKHAIRGKFVDLKEDGEWTTWQVTGVGTSELSEDQAKGLSDECSQDIGR